MYRFILKDSTGRVRGSMDQEQNSPNPWIPQFTRDGSIDDMIYDDNSTYSFEIVDVSAEYSEAEQKKQAWANAKAQLASVKDILQAAKALQNSPEKAVIKDLAKAVLQISKVINAANPLDSES
jgi:hypothetical protein